MAPAQAMRGFKDDPLNADGLSEKSNNVSPFCSFLTPRMTTIEEDPTPNRDGTRSAVFGEGLCLTQQSARREKQSAPSMLPSVLVEPSVPAACMSLLSLRSADGRAQRHHRVSGGDGNLPMLTKALSLVESSAHPSRAPNREMLTTGATTAPQGSSHRTAIRGAQDDNVSRLSTTINAASQISKRKPSGSRFWETVLEGARVPEFKHVAVETAIPRPGRPSAAPCTPPMSSALPSNEASSESDAYNPRLHVSRELTSHLKSPSRAPYENAFRESTSLPDGSSSERTAGSNADPQEEDESSKMNIPCVVCGVRFRKPGHLNMHWRSVHATSSDSAYPGKMHVRTLAGSSHRPFCDDRFRNRDVVASSGRISKTRGVRPYACPQCASRFRRGSDRNRHMRMVHDKIRPFECKKCGSHFGRKSFLEAHISTVHEKQRPFRCDCGAAFGQRSSLTRHAKKIHGRT